MGKHEGQEALSAHDPVPVTGYQMTQISEGLRHKTKRL